MRRRASTSFRLLDLIGPYRLRHGKHYDHRKGNQGAQVQKHAHQTRAVGNYLFVDRITTIDTPRKGF